MINFSKKILKEIAAFACDQYVVLFLILALAVKLCFFNTYITHVTWDQAQYRYGLGCSILTALFIFSPIYFVHKNKNKLAIILASVASLIILVDTVYYSYFYSLPTMGLISSIGQTGDVGPAIIGLFHWWFLLYFVDIILTLILIRFLKPVIGNIKDKYNLEKINIRASLIVTAVTIFALCLCVASIGFNKLTDVLNKGYDTISTSQTYGVLGAHAIDITRFIIQDMTHLSNSQVKSLSNWVKTNKPTQTTDSLTGIAKGKNVIMVQVESLGGFVLNQTVNNKEITPNLNKLASTSQFYPNDRFLLGGGHTSDTDFVSNTSYFPLNDTAIFVRYGADNFMSLPKTLIANGYSAYAYHGYNRNFWNRNVALKSLGYQKFYAADNYSKSWDINMGLNDGTFLSETADYIKTQPKPSLSYVITLSSHVPFSTNDKTATLGLDKSAYPDQVGGYLEDINYTDRMLGEFFAKLKKEGLYDDSLILVYGDHTPVLPAFKAGSINYDPTSVQQKEVPLIIKLPNDTTGEAHAKTGAHIDITPTILDVLGIKTTQLMFGQSLFTSNAKSLRVCANQLVAFNSANSCQDTLAEEKLKSAEIIRYNEFNNIK